MAGRIFWAGDSTVKQNNFTTYPQTGIGQGFLLYVKTGVQVFNYAENGRSTKSFLAEGRLIPIEEQIGEGDFLFIQFGHNDEKENDPDRFTEPYGSYQDNLVLFIDTARKHGAHPVLITPLYRRMFDEKGVLIEGNHLDYPDAMKELGSRMSVPVVDLCESSRQLYIRTGDEASREWFMQLKPGVFPNYPDGKKDNSQLVYHGAVTMAGLIVDGLRALGGVYADILMDTDEKLSAKDSALLAEEIKGN